MKVLVTFSLYRRFKNKATICFNVILFFAIFGLFFSDYVVAFVNPSFGEKEVVYVSNIEESLQTHLQENVSNYEFEVNIKDIKEQVEAGELVLEWKENQYTLHSKYAIPTMDILNIQAIISLHEKQKVMMNSNQIELLNEYNKEVIVNNEVLKKEESMSEVKANLIFMFISSVYFMMLSFISGVASEVVNEKTTKTLELILTSISAKTHFYSKLLVGWLVIVIQGILSISYIALFFLIRYFHDQGVGVLEFLSTLNIVPIEGVTFNEVLALLNLDFMFICKAVLIVFFLLVGILVMQLVLVIVSSFTVTIEEAANIQAPFYLMLLGIYYLVIALNNPQDLTEGLGYLLSFVPIFNMLLMPCRIMVQDVVFYEILISLGISLYLANIVIKRGIKIYEKGVLDYSSKGMLDILMKLK